MCVTCFSSYFFFQKGAPRAACPAKQCGAIGQYRVGRGGEVVLVDAAEEAIELRVAHLAKAGGGGGNEVRTGSYAIERYT